MDRWHAYQVTLVWLQAPLSFENAANVSGKQLGFQPFHLVLHAQSCTSELLA
jgi:hypothetical protein